MRNFKLLLATTAILSTSMAANVCAEGETPVTAANYSNRASATLTATIDIYNPITMTNGYINFPIITTGNMNNYDSVKVKLNYDGTIDYANSTAQIVNESHGSGPIKITGGDIGAYRSSFVGKTGDVLASTLAGHNSTGADGYKVWAGGNYSLAVADTIPMYELDTSGSQATSTLCGEVSDLQRYWNYNTALDNNKGGFEVSFGGTFTVDSDYNPTVGHRRCRGSTTVTLLVMGQIFE